SVGDKDRPLKERGINDAHLMAQQLKSLGVSIDFAFSSPANRALHTGLIFLRSLQYDFEQFRITDELYDFSGESVNQFLKSLSDTISVVLIFGHNYAFTNLVNMMGDAYLENLPTSGMAILEFNNTHWKNIQKGKTRKLVFPKELRE
ncbi:MAG: histidine phosphatase family protein, partial [Bacteroidota bacterium]